MCMTMLHGGVCHRTSTPHKSGNEMKEKKKIADFSINFSAADRLNCHVVPLVRGGILCRPVARVRRRQH